MTLSRTILLLTLAAFAMAEDAPPTIDQRVTAIEYSLQSVPFGLFQRVTDAAKAIKTITAIDKQQQDALNVHHDQIITLYNDGVAKDAVIAAQAARIAALEAKVALILGDG